MTRALNQDRVLRVLTTGAEITRDIARRAGLPPSSARTALEHLESRGLTCSQGGGQDGARMWRLSQESS